MRIILLLTGVLIASSGLFAQFKQIKPYNGPKLNPDLTIPKNLSSQGESEKENNNLFNYPPSDYFNKIGIERGVIRKIGNKIKSIKRANNSDLQNPDPIAAFFDFYYDLFKINTQDVAVISTVNNGIKTSHKLQQKIKGVDIYGAEATVQGDQEFIDFYLGNFVVAPADIDVSPALNTEEAWQKLYDIMPLGNLTLDVPKGLKTLLSKNTSSIDLVLYPSEAGDLILSYHFEYYQDGIHKKEIFMNAHSGEIYRQFDAYCKLHYDHQAHSNLPPPNIGQGSNLFNQNIQFNTWSEGSNHFLIDANRAMFNSTASNMPNDPVGVIWTLSGNGKELEDPSFSVSHTVSGSANWSNQLGISAHQNAAMAYEYYLNTFGRNSINGIGGNIVSIVNVGNNLENAFWNGQAMFYGNGGTNFFELARGLDVAGHEMSHGVVQSSANLEYMGESGALNESFADIFGAMIDREDWQIGEDVVRINSFPSGALRSMSNPHNGGQSLSDPGYQPQFYSERFTGSQDNGGVHINSGIVNHAYYLFATDRNVGRLEAEQVFYKVLTQFLTRSSDFSDLRAAAEEVVTNDFGVQSPELAALINAFNVTGIPGGGGQIIETEFESNPGNEFVIVTNASLEGIFILEIPTNLVPQLTELFIKNRPSVTDDGSTIVFVDGNGQLRFMQDFLNNHNVGFIEQSPQTIWENVIISRDGNRLAAITSDQVNEIVIFNLENNGQPGGLIYTLFNPTFTDGVSTGDVLFSDAMEFDHSGEVVLYDAFNRIVSTDGGSDIEYWDIGLLEVWDNNNTQFGSGNIQKLFNNLPANTSIGNPTFSKNSPTVVAFDLIQDDQYFVLGMNIETNDVQAIAENNTLGYPNYSTDDLSLVYDRLEGYEQTVSIIPLADNKINAAGMVDIFIEGGSRAVWYANGQREIVTSADDLRDIESLEIYPNPASDQLYVNLSLSNHVQYFRLTLNDILGKEVYSLGRKNIDTFNTSIDVNFLSNGLYILTLQLEDQKISQKIHVSK